MDGAVELAGRERLDRIAARKQPAPRQQHAEPLALTLLDSQQPIDYAVTSASALNSTRSSVTPVSTGLPQAASPPTAARGARPSSSLVAN